MNSQLSTRELIDYALRNWTPSLIEKASKQYAGFNARGLIMFEVTISAEEGVSASEYLRYIVTRSANEAWNIMQHPDFAQDFADELLLLNDYLQIYDPSSQAVIWLWNDKSASVHLLTDQARRN